MVFHVPCRVHFVLLKVVFELVDALSEDVDLVRLASVLEPDPSEQSRAVFDERDRDAQLDEANFFQSGGFLEVVGLFAEGETLGVKFEQVGHDTGMLDIYFEGAFGFEFHHGLVGAD